MASYIILDAYKKAVNCIEWDGEAPWTPPEGCSVRLMQPGDNFCTGAIEVNGVLEAPPPASVPADNPDAPNIV